MLRKIVSILALLCFLAISNSAIAAQLNWVGVDANWFTPANWGSAVPTINDWACIQPGYANQPIIDGDAACSPLDIAPWSGGGICSVDMNSGTLNFGSALNCATWGTWDSSAPGFSPGILYVHGGTVTTQTENSAGLVIGSQFGPSAGRVIMYGGLISVPRIALYNGDIALYGGTLELKNSADDANADANFVFSQIFMRNKISIEGGTLKAAGPHVTEFTGYINSGRIYSARGSIGVPVIDGDFTTLTSSDNNLIRAWGPQPFDKATNIHYKTPDGNTITLSWNKGDYDANVIDQNVYFGTASGALALQGTRYAVSVNSDGNGLTDPCTWTLKEPNKFTVGATYYWRIDEVNTVSGAVAKGLEWAFKVHDGKAYNLKPQNGATSLSEPFQLSWTAGDWQGTQHRVFFGTTFSSVDNASTTSADGRYRGTVSSPAYPLIRLLEKGPVNPGGSWPLTAGTQYYWRIDEVNSTTVWKGNTQPFTPSAYIIIDDFEDYNSTDDVNANWPNDYTITNGCLNPEYWSPSIGHSGRLMMQDASGKYLRYTYNNSGSAVKTFSEARRPYSDGTTFTGGGALTPAPRALRVDYLGSAINPVDPVYDRMYVVFEDTSGNVSVYQNPDGNAAQVVSWTSWFSKIKDINAAGAPLPVQLEAMSSFAIGFGMRCRPGGTGGGDGNVMFDNVGLYGPSCVLSEATELTADLDRDCDVDINDMDVFADEWLKHADDFVYSPINAPRAPILWYKFDETETALAQDSGTGDANNYVGTINNWSAMSWKPTGGHDGNGCLYLPSGRNSSISIDMASLSFMGDANHSGPDGGGITFSTWINADLTAFGGWIYGFIVVKDVNGNDATEIACPHHYSPYDWSANNAWAGWAKNGNPSFSLGPSTVPANYGGRWNHWAFVKAPHTVSWYCNGSLIKQEADTDANAGDPNIYGPLFPLPVSAFTIGLGGWGGNWAGRIDDFQVYDYALTAPEVQWLATDRTGEIVLPLVSTANFNYDGGLSTDKNQKVNFGDLAIMGQQWHTQILWP